MTVFHQMGHQSDNLLASDQLAYRGAILSPVNYDQEGISRIINHFGVPGFETIFDPQMYYPRSEKGKLQTWRYFPADYNTADMTSEAWWNQVIASLVEIIQEISPNAVCSPTPVPRVYQNDYYLAMTRLSNSLCERLTSLGISVLQTVIANLADLSDYRRVHEIASIVTQGEAGRIYLIFNSQTTPRRELNNTDELKGAMLLIKLLEESGIRVVVGYCSADIILWKEAGATDCATGKFFNLRRFTPSRWVENEEGGGGQLPYWFEEGLVAYLRESDISRVRRGNIFSDASNRNPFTAEILQNISVGNPWVALGWKQYLYWFSDVEARLRQHETNADQLLSVAEENWTVINNIRNPKVLMEEIKNNGDWVRLWHRAVLEYSYPW